MPQIPPPMIFPIAIPYYSPYYRIQYPNYPPPFQISHIQKNESPHKKFKKDKKDKKDKKEKKNLKPKQLKTKLQKFRQNRINKLHKKLHPHSISFNGIFSELTQRNMGQNINDAGIIEISGNRKTVSSNSLPYGTFSSIVNYSYSGRCYSSRNEPNSFLTFDFKENNRIALSAYSIKSSRFIDGPFLLSWAIEGSDDNASWALIDERKNERELAKDEQVKTFEVRNQEITRMFSYFKTDSKLK